MQATVRSCSGRSVFCSTVDKVHHQRRPRAVNIAATATRRELLFAVPWVSFLAAQPVQAGPIGEKLASLWKSTQQSNAGKILAPIKVAQQRLAQAAAMMEESPSAIMPVLQAVRSSSMNCYVFEAMPEDTIETKASLASQQFQFSDPCTFRLIVKNITDPSSNPRKVGDAHSTRITSFISQQCLVITTGLSSDAERQQGEALIASLINSYQKLDGELEGAISGGPAAAARAQAQLQSTMNVLNALEVYVNGVLAV